MGKKIVLAFSVVLGLAGGASASPLDLYTSCEEAINSSVKIKAYPAYYGIQVVKADSTVETIPLHDLNVEFKINNPQPIFDDGYCAVAAHYARIRISRKDGNKLPAAKGLNEFSDGSIEGHFYCLSPNECTVP